LFYNAAHILWGGNAPQYFQLVFAVIKASFMKKFAGILTAMQTLRKYSDPGYEKFMLINS